MVVWIICSVILSEISVATIERRDRTMFLKPVMRQLYYCIKGKRTLAVRSAWYIWYMIAPLSGVLPSGNTQNGGILLPYIEPSQLSSTKPACTRYHHTSYRVRAFQPAK